MCPLMRAAARGMWGEACFEMLVFATIGLPGLDFSTSEVFVARTVAKHRA